MRIIHYRIYIIGGGGVGSWLLPSMCLLEKPGNITCIDGDMLEFKNLNRQLFTEKDIGQNKAKALAQKYACKCLESWFSSGLIDLSPRDWLMVCVDNHRARLEALQECDSHGCQAIFACNETHSAEAFYYRREWMGGPLDPRTYYPEIATDPGGDPRAAAIGCTGDAQANNTQLVSANFMASSLAQHLYVLWAMEVPAMEGAPINRLPNRLYANLSRVGCDLISQAEDGKEEPCQD
jgi:hypothetical protein